MDTLSKLLSMYHMRTVLDVRCHFRAPWMLDHPAAARGIAPYHLIVRGEARIGDVRLAAGDIVVFPHGDAHLLYLGDPAASLPPHRTPGLLRLDANEGDGPATDILCGEFRFETDASLLMALPPMLVVRTSDRPDSTALRNLIEILQSEAETPRPGSEEIVKQLASALFALLIRCSLEQSLLVPGLFAVMADRRLQTALHAMLASPQQAWTLEDLAEACHMSRATFARLFTKAAGAPPATVLTQLRMTQAAGLLEAGNQAGEVAASVGYQSEAAFNRAFKRRYGVGPGTYRRQKADN